MSYIWANPITQIEENAFAGLVNLESHWLTDIDVNSLDSNVLEGLPRALKLALNGVWHCDSLCRLKREEAAERVMFKGFSQNVNHRQ